MAPSLSPAPIPSFSSRTISASLSAAVDRSVAMVVAYALRPSNVHSLLDVEATEQAPLVISKEIHVRFNFNFIFKLTKLVQK
jgi:hypothetical protein